MKQQENYPVIVETDYEILENDEEQTEEKWQQQLKLLQKIQREEKNEEIFNPNQMAEQSYEDLACEKQVLSFEKFEQAIDEKKTNFLKQSRQRLKKVIKVIIKIFIFLFLLLIGIPLITVSVISILIGLIGLGGSFFVMGAYSMNLGWLILFLCIGLLSIEGLLTCGFVWIIKKIIKIYREGNKKLKGVYEK
jgi:hypothetical protein